MTELRDTSLLPTSRVLDGTGIALSGLCIVHCLVVPIAAAFLPVLGAFEHAAWLHWAFAFVAMPVSALAMHRAYREGAPAWLLWLAALGVALLFAGATEFLGHAWLVPLTVAGGLCLAASHALHWRMQTRSSATGRCAA